jgi:hypothetical protein
MADSTVYAWSQTWAIVAATGLGPIFAVLISIWREHANSKSGRRLHVFRTLMATRRVAISLEHVNALNLVEVDFYKCRNVEGAWREYKNHLYSGGPEDAAWTEKKEKLLAKLLFEIAAVLGFKIPAIDIFQGGYAPRGWFDRERLAVGALEYLRQLSTRENSFPIWVHGGTTQPQPETPALNGKDT